VFKRTVRALLSTAFCTAAMAGCPPVGSAERLLLEGTLEREGIERTDDAAVVVDYLSDGSRGEWWPCDLRMTAQGCVDGKHVNVYAALPNVTSIDGLARNACVVDGVPYGVYELIDDTREDELALGTEVNAFVLVASNVNEPAGADLSDDEETHAASRLVSGTLSIFEKGRPDEPLYVKLVGRTAAGRDVTVEFNGPMSAPLTIPPLESPSTCVDDALVD
jgi:hypothetical protein